MGISRNSNLRSTHKSEKVDIGYLLAVRNHFLFIDWQVNVSLSKHEHSRSTIVHDLHVTSSIVAIGLMMVVAVLVLVFRLSLFVTPLAADSFMEGTEDEGENQ